MNQKVEKKDQDLEEFLRVAIRASDAAATVVMKYYNSKLAVEAKTDDDELLVHACDLDATIFGKTTIFDFARHRRIEHYGMITSRTGAEAPTA